MTIAQLYQHVIDYFEETMPMPQTELHYDNPFSLLVAVILSAQCTDKRVNMITPALMARYPDAETMSHASSYDIFEYIRSCSYPNNKSRHLADMSRILVEKYGGQVPSSFDDLLSLPGVGRKTANVMLSVAFGQQAIAVDTHVFRVSARIGLTRNAATPLETEKQLTKHFPKHLLGKAHHWLILHGRYVCKAIKPNCNKCGLADICHCAVTNAR